MNARPERAHLIFMKNNMNMVKNILAFVSAAVLMIGCSGAVDDSTLPVLKASSAEVDLADAAEVEFSVTFDGVDVTAESKILSVESGNALVGNVFVPEAEGEFSFCAEYDGKKSEIVVVTVINTAVTVESIYERHVALIEFTGAWCTNCPKGYDEMMNRLNRPSMSEYRDYIHLCAFHSNAEGSDELAISATQDVFKLFKGLSYPSFAIDLRNEEGFFGVLNEDGLPSLIPGLKSAFDDYPAHCGVAVSSAMNSDKSKAVVSVKVTSELTSQYRVLLFVVENNIKAMQMHPPLYPNGNPDYIHHHVVRKVVTSYQDTFTGEKITDDGRIKAGQEVSKDWTLDVDGGWNLENTEIYALVLDAEGAVNNMNICAVDNGTSDYKVKKQ